MAFLLFLFTHHFRLKKISHYSSLYHRRFFAVSVYRFSEIGTRGFSGMLIPNMTSVLQYEACVSHFYHDYLLSFFSYI